MRRISGLHQQYSKAELHRGIEDLREKLRALREKHDVNDLVDPQELTVYLEAGIDGADEARFDVRWFRPGYYNVHYTDSDRDFRWDYHPKDGAPDRRFHPPPTAESTDPEPSCITVEQPELVARAVHKLWRRAFDEASVAHLNTAETPREW